MTTKRQLEAEVERLRGEVALLRAQQAAHVCMLSYGPSARGPQCTCGTTVRCLKHFAADWTGWIYAGNVCAGAAGVPQTLAIKSGDFTWLNPAAAGAAGVPQVFTFNVPA